MGSVIRNPEIQKLVPALMAAIAEPEKHGKKALDQLLGTTFVNTVDAASLSLIVPVVHKSLRDRSGDSKKRAARIVGSMCALMNDPKVCLVAQLLFANGRQRDHILARHIQTRQQVFSLIVTRSLFSVGCRTASLNK